MTDQQTADPDGFKIVTISLEQETFEPYPMRFYEGTDPADMELAMKETITNLRDYAKNQNLKVWSATKDKPASPEKKNNEAEEYDQNNLILSEVYPSARGSPDKKFKEVVNFSPNVDDGYSNSNPAFISVDRTKVNAIQAQSSKNSTEGPSVIRANYQYVIHPSEKGSVIKVRPMSAVQRNLRSKSPNKNDPNSEKKKRIAQANSLFQKVESTNQQDDADDVFVLPQREIPQFITGNVCVEHISGNNPAVYDPNRVIMPFSYIRYTKEPDTNNPKLPAPTYIKFEVLNKTKNFVKEQIFKGLEITKIGELKLVDKEILEKQKGIAWEVIKKVAQSIADGRGVVGVSLPVRIFEPRSMLERVCDWFTYIPRYGIEATQLNDPVERMRRVITMAVGGLYVSAKQVKPFNPLLGETFQAHFPDHGIKIDMEHTSHHPPIANFLLEHQDFKFWGRYIFKADLAKMSGNLSMIMDGPNHMDFKDGTRITFNWPDLKLSGMFWGDRVCKYHHDMYFVDKKNKLKAVLQFGEAGNNKEYSKRVDAISGSIYRYDPELEAQLLAKKTSDIDKKQKDKVQEVSSIFGLYLEFLKIDGKKVWDIDQDKPIQYFPIENPLPSDCRFREDLIFVKNKDFKLAENWKLKLEERQRYERKLRQDYAKKHK